jgi:glucodextranase-like protein
VIDAGFLELVRLGILPPDDADVAASLPIVDSVIGRMTPSGQGFYRYGTDLAGSEDGYGDCFEPDATNCSPSGRPWPTGNAGSGHLWPVLSGERAEYALESGDSAAALALLGDMDAFASGVGLVPEQDWENPALAPSPFGTPPETASIGFEPGKAAGSASPLTWAQAQEARLALSIGRSHPIEQPAIVRARYVDQAPPANLPITLTAPADGTSTNDTTVDVTGTTEPGAVVTVAATPVEIPGDTTRVTTTAGGDGSFSVTVPLIFGANVLTVAAAKGGATGYAHRTITSEATPGTTVLDVTDPSGDDHGPGTFQYPTDSAFHDGAFDLTRFQVIDGGSIVFLRATLRDLTPTFGPTNGAQLLDVFVRNPSAGSFSTAAPFPQRNYTIASDSAWSERLEVQGFAGPVFVDAGGNSLGTIGVSANSTSKAITMAVPASALGHPTGGWVFSVVLHGQNGFSPDQARGFAPTPQPFDFGLCPVGGVSPICSINPGTAPKAMDVTAPAGTDQSTELDPTLGPVTIHGVPVP